MGKQTHSALRQRRARAARGVPPARGIGPRARLLLARWPSVLGLLALLANASAGPNPHLVSMIIILAAMCYLAAAALGFRHAGWFMIAVSVIVVVGAGLTGLDKTGVLLALGVGFGIFGFLRGGMGRREVALQAAAFAGFGALALAAMFAQPLLAAYLAAGAAIGHAGWDVVHFIRNKVVDRSLAEFCFLLDLGLGALLLLTASGALAW